MGRPLIIRGQARATFTISLPVLFFRRLQRAVKAAGCSRNSVCVRGIMSALADLEKEIAERAAVTQTEAVLNEPF